MNREKHLPSRMIWRSNNKESSNKYRRHTTVSFKSVLNQEQDQSEQVYSEDTFKNVCSEQTLQVNKPQVLTEPENTKQVLTEQVLSKNTYQRNNSITGFKCEIVCSQIQKTFETETEFSLHNEFFHSGSKNYSYPQ